MRPDFRPLWAAVEAAPKDAAPKLIAADWLQERGLDPDLERGLRWCAAKRKWPRFGYGGEIIRTCWHWYINTCGGGPRTNYEIGRRLEAAIDDQKPDVPFFDRNCEEDVIDLIRRTGLAVATLEARGVRPA